MTVFQNVNFDVSSRAAARDVAGHSILKLLSQSTRSSVSVTYFELLLTRTDVRVSFFQ